MSTQRPPGLRLHPRTRLVASAEADFRTVVLTWLEAHDDLTDIEQAQIMLLAPAIPLKFALRAERHPDDPARKADEA